MDKLGPEKLSPGKSGENALQLNDVSKIYPGTVALYRVNIEVKKGEVHGIIGKNGAGKSTLVGIVAGITPPTEGEIILGDKRFAALSRITSKKERVSIVPQEPQVILDFTVAENLFMADYVCRGVFINWRELYARAERVMKKAGLNLNIRAKARDLSISEQQLMLVVKACFVENARVIILDEVSASLSQDDVKLLYNIIEERKKEGVTILFISHRTDELLRICDRVTVIRDGRSIVTRDCPELDEEKLSHLIVGEDMNFETSREEIKDRTGLDETVLSVENFTKFGVFQNISFSLKRGEILGIAGLRGSGRTELFKGIAGIDPVDAGLVSLGKLRKRFTNPSEALRNGIVYLPEDRDKEGLISMLSVRENLVLNSLRKVTRGGLISRKKENEFAANITEMLGIKAASCDQEASQLSGGNKQRVVVGRISAAGPKVLLLDEPTRGVDISAKGSILKTIKENLSRSAGIVITSPGLEDLIQICDRILILYKGEITGEFPREDFREGDLFLAMQGVLKGQKKCYEAIGNLKEKTASS